MDKVEKKSSKGKEEDRYISFLWFKPLGEKLRNLLLVRKRLGHTLLLPAPLKPYNNLPF